MNGNINTLKRKAIPVSGGTSTLVDNLEYKYTGNRLNQVIELAMNDTGYEGGNNMIDYDSNGNMTTMKDKNINSIGYNYLNLPNQLFINQKFSGWNHNTNITHLYRADGLKLRTTKYSAIDGDIGDTAITDYLDGFQYRYYDNGLMGVPLLQDKTSFAYEDQAYTKTGSMFPSKPKWQLDFVPTSEGFYSFTENRYIYHYKDHLGNTRVSFAKNSAGVLEVTDTNNYYPFGLNHIGGIKGQLGSYKNYKYQGQELQETGFYSFKWREYMPDIGRFAQIDPLSEKYPYNSTYAFQENKLGMGVELEGLELLKNHTGFFAIHGNAIKVKRAPVSQRDRNGSPTFTAGDIGLSTSGYNPNGARISSGNTGLRLDSYKYDGPVPDAVQMQNTRDKISTKVRQSFKTTKTGAEMWNIKQYRADQASAASSGIKEIVKLAKLGANIPDAIKSTSDYVQAVNDVTAVKSQALTMDQAIKYVDGSGIEMNQQTRNDVVNYVFDGTLPNPDAGLMPNSLIIQNGAEIMRTNGIPIQPLDEQLTTKSRNIPQ